MRCWLKHVFNSRKTVIVIVVVKLWENLWSSGQDPWGS